MGCPYQGEVSVDMVVNLAAQMSEMGCSEISLGDTIGIGTPMQAKNMMESVEKKFRSQIWRYIFTTLVVRHWQTSTHAWNLAYQLLMLQFRVWEGVLMPKALLEMWLLKK